MHLIEKDLRCPVCQELPQDAVQSSCCHGLFCAFCSSKLKCTLSQSRCSYCGEVTTFSPCHFLRKRIGQLTVQCRIPGCKVEMLEKQRKQHQNNCDFKKDACVWCGSMLTRKQISMHLKTMHPQNTEKVLLRLEPLKGFMQISGIKEYNPIQKIKNSYGRWASLGITGKYYCAGPLQTKCLCCNGICGPFNGENCRACMLLDVSTRKLDYGKYLVNIAGRTCIVSGARVWCGIRKGAYEGICRDESCVQCQVLMRNISRYLDVQSQLSEPHDTFAELLI